MAASPSRTDRVDRTCPDRRTPFAQPKAMDLKAVQRVKPSEKEIASNPRARSAILRVAERLSSLQHEAVA